MNYRMLFALVVVVLLVLTVQPVQAMGETGTWQTISIDGVRQDLGATQRVNITIEHTHQVIRVYTWDAPCNCFIRPSKGEASLYTDIDHATGQDYTLLMQSGHSWPIW